MIIPNIQNPEYPPAVREVKKEGKEKEREGREGKERERGRGVDKERERKGEG